MEKIIEKVKNILAREKFLEKCAIVCMAAAVGGMYATVAVLLGNWEFYLMGLFAGGCVGVCAWPCVCKDHTHITPPPQNYVSGEQKGVKKDGRRAKMLSLRKGWLVWLAVVLLVAVVIGLALAVNVASATCPEPGPRVNVIYLANVQQGHVDGMWACLVHPYRCLGR